MLPEADCRLEYSLRKVISVSEDGSVTTIEDDEGIVLCVSSFSNGEWNCGFDSGDNPRGRDARVRN